MFDAATEAQRDAITVMVFIGTFFVALGIGRFLKRRAGVHLGLFFRLFCLILAFYGRDCRLRSSCTMALSCWFSSNFVEHCTDRRSR